MNRLASATIEEKEEILDIANEQVRFKDLWAVAPSIRMRQVNWKKEPFHLLNALLKSFYAPLLYRGQGYCFGNAKIDKEDFLDGMPVSSRKVCPYCDNYLQKTELDHFLPKDEFPFLS